MSIKTSTSGNPGLLQLRQNVKICWMKSAINTRLENEMRKYLLLIGSLKKNIAKLSVHYSYGLNARVLN